MRMKLGTLLVVAGLVLAVSVVMGDVGEVDAGELVRKVRADEGWLHEVGSLYLRSESVGRTEDGRRPVSVFEVAWDEERIYMRSDNESLDLEDVRVFDGEQVVHRYAHRGREEYVLGDQPYEQIGRGMFVHLMWPRARAHEGFWWVPEDDDYAKASLSFYGKPEEFVLAGREEYKGVECYVLERDAYYMRLYIGAEDHRQYGFTNRTWSRATEGERFEIVAALAEEWDVSVGSWDEFHEWKSSLPEQEREEVEREYWRRQRHLSEPGSEQWTMDWREVAPGRWFPMLQGHRTFPIPDLGIEEGRVFEQRIVELRIDEALEEELFEIEIPEGARVTDRRFEPLVLTYEQKAERTEEEWEEMLKAAQRRQDEEQRR